MHAVLPLLLSIALCHSSGASGSGEEPSVDRETLEQLRGLNGQELSILEEEAKGAPVTDGYRRAVEGEADRRRQAEFITAAQTGDTATVRRFIDSKAYDIDFRDENGDTLLIHAIRNGQSDTAAVLKKAGASEAVKNHEGHTALTVGNKDKVQTFIRFAKSTKPSRKRNALLQEFTRLNAGRLSTNEAIALARATTIFSGTRSHNQIIRIFFEAHHQTLPPDEAIKLSKATLDNAQSMLLPDFVRDNAGRLSTDEAIELATATTNAESHNKILLNYATFHAARLSTDEAIRLAQHAWTFLDIASNTRAKIIWAFFEAHKSTLSTDQAIRLGYTATDIGYRGKITQSFYRARKGRLSKDELQKLFDAMPNSGGGRKVRDEILADQCSEEVSEMMWL